MAKKIKNKSELLKKWSGKIQEQRQYFSELKKAGQAIGRFEDSPVYRNLDKRRGRAVYRYENRERISEQRKVARIERLKLQFATDENESIAKTAFSGSAIDAFKGIRGKNDLDFAKKILESKPGRKFAGSLLVVDGETGEVLDDYKTTGFVRYFKRLSEWIAKLFDRDAGYSIFNSSVDKKILFDKETDTLYYWTNIEKSGDE